MASPRLYPAPAPSLRRARARPEIRSGMVLGTAVVIAQKAALGMLGPFLIDLGLPLTTVGLLNGGASLGLGMAGAILGGALVRRWGIRATLLIALSLQALLLACLAVGASGLWLPRPLLVTAALLSGSAVMALGFSALYAQFMSWSDPAQGGVDFTIFQCLDGAISMGLGIAAGMMAQAAGYGTLLALCAGRAVRVAVLLQIPFKALKAIG